ncbi:MAG TPA: ATP-binding protein [Solirubrobacteraceae bacterium]|nr:ATP-binding protein [Solirubrobacteraceae bacterium]
MEDVTAGATVRLSLQSRPESVALVRMMLSGASEELMFGAELLADLKTAVSEACNNVVVHAYRDGSPGPMTVTLRDLEDSVVVTVADAGSGLVAGAPASDGLGVGLAVIDALVAKSDFRSAPGGGTEVEMVFTRERPEEPAAGRDLVEEPVAAAAAVSGPPAAGAAAIDGQLPQDSEILLEVDPAGLLGGILGRVAGAVAAESAFSIDRYSEVSLVTDSIAAHARTYAQGQHLLSRLHSAEKRLDLEVGPFHPGSLAKLQAQARGASPALLAMLVDELSAESGAGGEQLRMVLTDSHQAGTVTT